MKRLTTTCAILCLFAVYVARKPNQLSDLQKSSAAPSPAPNTGATGDSGLFWVGVFTLCVLMYQANEMRKATLAMRLSIEEVRRQTGIMSQQTTAIREEIGIMERQTRAIEKQAQALVNSERAWVIAELVPVCTNFGNGRWARRVGGHLASLSDLEILKGEHLRQQISFTNMGRTPAHILRYQITYTCLRQGAARLGEGAISKHDSGRIFDHLLAATDSVDAPETVDVNEHMVGHIKEINQLHNTALFHGWVEYLHVFSDVEVVKVPFCYVYKPSTLGLERVPEVKVGPNTESDESKKQNPN
jgi:hypothetical protein